MTPVYLKNQLSCSLRNLGLQTVDGYFIHNPETQLAYVKREQFESSLKAAFEALEEEAADGRIRSYGVATWNGFRVGPEAQDFLDLSRLLELAKDVAGKGHHFHIIQLPYNLAMTEAFGLQNQKGSKKASSTLQAAAAGDLTVLTSASLLQGRVSV